MEYTFSINKLSREFYEHYPNELFPEIASKENRAYTIILIDLNGFFVGLPYRSYINHKYGYLFRHSERSRRTKSGIDYTKAVIINENLFIGAETVVDQDEYKETVKNIEQIVNESSKYIDEYCNHVSGVSKLDIEEFDRRYKYTTLKYFHDVLDIEIIDNLNRKKLEVLLDEEPEL